MRNSSRCMKSVTCKQAHECQDMLHLDRTTAIDPPIILMLLDRSKFIKLYIALHDAGSVPLAAKPTLTNAMLTRAYSVDHVSGRMPPTCVLLKSREVSDARLAQEVGSVAAAIRKSQFAWVGTGTSRNVSEHQSMQSWAAMYNSRCRWIIT